MSDSRATVLFVDLTDSTRLYERLGDAPARALTAEALGRLETVAIKQNGRVVKHTGDGLLCTFEDPTAATRAAMGMMASLEELKASDEVELHACIGMHHGPLLEDRGDVFGDAVNLAARMMQLARPRQIYATEETVDALEPAWRVAARPQMESAVKGKVGLRRIFEIVWETDALTAHSSQPSLPPTRHVLELRWQDRILRLDAAYPIVRLGRQTHNDLVIIGSRVSRSHARIEHRGRRFVLVDESKNGTWVLPYGGAPRLVCRDELVLEDWGHLGLGEEPVPGELHTVCYEILNEDETE